MFSEKKVKNKSDKDRIKERKKNVFVKKINVGDQDAKLNSTVITQTGRCTTAYS